MFADKWCTQRKDAHGNICKISHTHNTLAYCAGDFFWLQNIELIWKKNSEKMHHESKMNAKECALSREKEEEFSAANCIII